MTRESTFIPHSQWAFVVYQALCSLLKIKYSQKWVFILLSLRLDSSGRQKILIWSVNHRDWVQMLKRERTWSFENTWKGNLQGREVLRGSEKYSLKEWCLSRSVCSALTEHLRLDCYKERKFIWLTVLEARKSKSLGLASGWSLWSIVVWLREAGRKWILGKRETYKQLPCFYNNCCLLGAT